MDYVEARQRLVVWLRSRLIGPAKKSGIIRENPLQRFPVGVLSPITISTGTLLNALAIGQSVEDLKDEASSNRYYAVPSAVGFSFLVSRDAQLNIEASAVCYERLRERDPDSGQFTSPSFERVELPPCENTIGQPRTFQKQIWESRAGIRLQALRGADDILCTLALYNRQHSNQVSKDVQRHLFETELKCTVTKGLLLEVPRTHVSMLTKEEHEFKLQYRSRKIFAMGHGSAVDWKVTPGAAPQIWSEFMPAVEIPALSTNPQGSHPALDLKILASEEPAAFAASIDDFLSGYESWISGQRRAVSRFSDPSDHKTALRMVRRMEVALRRMRQGASLLLSDRIVGTAFQTANRAMLNQMQQTDRIARRDTDNRTYRWRSFQLAFLLTVLESVVLEDSDFRDTVDLIWFPTGGGKTEAYLGLIAFLIVWRRLTFGHRGGGTVAIMRYTLRLLTRQQFERAARMVCALELIRREDANGRFGSEPFSTGIWVGGAVSPNWYRQAEEVVKNVRGGDATARYQLVVTACPWCRVTLDVKNGYLCDAGSFNFRCTNYAGCTFARGSQPLPCQVVDEALYEHPPSLLISTIDKFARLAWIDGPRAFFGSGTRAPDLIIQDELHLVSGPVGSVAGMYEAGIDTTMAALGVNPKYVASTATISEVRDQVQKLYARSVNVFPPPGLSCDDTYFACTDRERPGRLYLGYLAPRLTRQASLAPVIAALMAAPGLVFGQDLEFEALAEAWWTAVVFNRSLRDVARSHATVINDVQIAGTRLIKEGKKNDKTLQERLDKIGKRFDSTSIAELTSRRPADECAATFTALTYDRTHESCLDMVFATNMISVGLDVSRLALMVVNGQPQTTGEYIQTTSRVGRAAVPGLVVVNYYRNQARSLAHYENFRPFHDSFYRFVEPSSVTPFTYQVRRRALHAALVIALRYSCEHLLENGGASRIGSCDAKEKRIVSRLLRRCHAACGEQALLDEIGMNLDQLLEAWQDLAATKRKQRRKLNYQVNSGSRAASRLLKPMESSQPGLWRTLNSMRSVEQSAMLKTGSESVEVRISHLLRECGVGSIVRNGSSLIVVPDIHRWDARGADPLRREIKYVAQIRQHLGIGNVRLIKPPAGIEKDGRVLNWIRVARFPRWARCRKCGLLYRNPWQDEGCKSDAQCTLNSCKGQLEQVRWILVHRLGYLADVDWHYMAHGNSRNKKQKECKRVHGSPYLKLRPDLKGPVVCTNCNASGWEDMAYFGRLTSQQPWLRKPAPEHTEDCRAEVMQIGDSRAYVPENKQALVIPPESRIRRGTIVDRLFGSAGDQRTIANACPGLDLKSTLRRIASKYECTVVQLQEALEEIDRGYPLYGEALDSGDLLRLEYEALTRPIPDLRPDEDFITCHRTEEWQALSKDNVPRKIRQTVGLVDRLVSVDRLRMISVFTGFRRMATRDVCGGAGGLSTHQEPALVPPDIFGRSDWLPAGELYGEGLFFSLSESVLDRWEKKVENVRTGNSALAKFLGYATLIAEGEESSIPRFILCHSLAHLLIRQLERSSGYPAASIQERIYCESGQNAMAGILLFVAVADDYGSLGGIMEYAEPWKFFRLLSGALDAARWCSFDPVCSRLSEEEYGQLNGAACHACMMLPEPSCCRLNRYLDRTLIRGTGRTLPSILEMTDS